MNDRKVGVWLIGAFGSISTTTILGALAVKKGLTDPSGMITTTEPFQNLDLAPVESMEFGGCDIRPGSLSQAAQRIVREVASVDFADLVQFKTDFERIEQVVVQGITRNCGEAIGRLAASPAEHGNKSVREEIAEAAGHLKEFKAKRGLHELVVVNVASTEPPLRLGPDHEDLAAFESCLDSNKNEAVRASTIYAYAAIKAGCPYINFTPSNGALFPAMAQLAEQNNVPVMGNDGKTGETLVKSALAPMFLCRNLEILSWEGFNILGNMDGHVLDHPENKESKIHSKDAVLAKILGYTPHSQVHINYVPSLGDRKTAWDFIHFRGFLGAKMSLQFVWQGYDSLLAAPLILDLVRLAELAKRRRESGLMPHLACFFKDPLGVTEHELYEQFRMLMDYVQQARETG